MSVIGQPRSVVSEDWIDNAPIRAAVEQAVAGGMTYSAICRALGWLKPNGSGDTSRLRRRIGAMPHLAGNGRHDTSRTINYELAVQIARAIDIDPVEVGL